jgi:hypothetical protein
MHPTNGITQAADTIRSGSALTESTFLQIGETLQSSIEILASLTDRFEAVLTELRGEKLGQALKALSRTAARIAEPDDTQTGVSARLARQLVLSEAVADRIARLTDSLGDVAVLAMNVKIAAAHIRVPGIDFSSFAEEIGRTLRIAHRSLAGFSAELGTVCQHLAAAHAGQLAFERHQREAARSIRERLMATVEALTRQNQRAARATVAVRQSSVRVRQSIGDAVMALQIGDITCQRLEHTDYALGLLAAMRKPPVDGYPALDGHEQNTFAILTHRLQAAQCSDAARAFDHEVTRITESLGSLAEEAHGLWTLGGPAYGASDRGGSTVLAALEGQVGEALALFEQFEATRAEVASTTAKVSDATASLRGHLRKMQTLEADIRIMGLNTTFKCARIGREGLALSLIAQELRTFAYGFAKEAGALVGVVETIAAMAGSLAGGTRSDGSMLIAAGMREIRDSVSTLRQVGQILDDALADLERDSGRVVTLLEDTVADLAARDEIGRMLREAAEVLAATAPYGYLEPDELTPPLLRMIGLVALGYTMASERAVHEKILGRSAGVVADAGTEASPEVEDVLF